VKTLAELKRRIQPGVRLHIDNHIHPHISRDCEVIRAQTKDFSTTHPDAPRGSWVTYPAAKNLRWNDDGTVTFMESRNVYGKTTREGAPFITVRFLEGCD
jgi:hypothetical protein